MNQNQDTQSSITGPFGLPRRCFLDRMTPAETAISKAIQAVEEAGCDPLLTDAVTLLIQAKVKVADFVDREILAGRLKVPSGETHQSS